MLYLKAVVFFVSLGVVLHYVSGLFLYLLYFKLNVFGLGSRPNSQRFYVDMYPKLSRYFDVCVDREHRKVGEGLLILMFANKGTGKTTIFSKMVQNAVRGKKDKITKTRYTEVFCNVPIYGANKFDVQEYLGRRDMPEGSVIYIDEGALELPNTLPLTKEQALFMILQRHAKCTIYVISQSHEDINIKLRRLYQKVFFLKRGLVWGLFSDFTTMIEYKKELMIDEETHQFVEGYFKTFPIPNVSRFTTWRPTWYKYFDSYDMPKLKDGAVPIEPWSVELPPTLLSRLLRKVSSVRNSQSIEIAASEVVRKQSSIENYEKSFPLENESGSVVRLGGETSSIASQVAYMENYEK